MRIAVPYENGEIFHHFGHTEQIRLYGGGSGATDAAARALTEGSLRMIPKPSAITTAKAASAGIVTGKASIAAARGR